jgi:DNA replication and repair protein RecF
VLFCPEHLSLIKDGPAERRNYLDIALSRISQKYIHSLQRYNYFLKQRNSLIKSAYHDRATFDATVDLWSEKMADEAALISKMRYEFICRISPLVNQSLCKMTGEREQTELVYRGSVGLSGEEYLDCERIKQRYIELLSGSHDREIGAGATLWGIHKDDLEIKLNGKNARIFASQGQQRSLALALKLAEGEVTREEFGDYPVFLFDDVLSELDETRRDSLLLFDTDKQVIITTCEAGVVEKIEAQKKIRVENGRYCEV